MFNLKAYLDSGIIEQYCLGMTSAEEMVEVEKLALEYPAIAEAIKANQKGLAGFLKAFQKKANPHSRQIIKQSIAENRQWEDAHLNEDHQLQTYLDISRYTDPVLVEALVKDIPAPALADYDNVYVKTLFSGEGKELGLFWVKERVPAEEHPEIEECFILLEGTADCYIDNQVFKMTKGDFMRIPPSSHHRVIVTSPQPARAIRARSTIQRA